ncbi:MAG: hypothetical protein Q8S13_01025 [Dehalococcoidia bacterium]|nr:hypothetical protein [Dehalococcoidia bacterium]
MSTPREEIARIARLCGCGAMGQAAVHDAILDAVERARARALDEACAAVAAAEEPLGRSSAAVRWTKATLIARLDALRDRSE